MSMFQRVRTFFSAEAHAVVDKLEDPIKMTEQGIRDLKTDLRSSMTGLAEVKALAIRTRKEAEEQTRVASDYERKAVLLLERSQSGQLEPAEAERLATEVLARREEATQRATRATSEYEQHQRMADQLQSKISGLKSTVGRYENELVTLRARSQTANSVKKINKQLSGMDPTGTVAMLEKMKARVDEEESLAQAYGEILEEDTGVDRELERALGNPAQVQASQSLLELKAKLGMDTKALPGARLQLPESTGGAGSEAVPAPRTGQA
ncbi:MAG: PspA/IM30 family protein [Gemmatimonas sp.]|nr:PspA/IM30 family protein [Gemmatimonas sp.]